MHALLKIPLAVTYNHMEVPGFREAMFTWNMRQLLVVCGLAMLFAYGVARTICARSDVMASALKQTPWRQTRWCLVGAAIVSASILIAMDFVLGDYFLFKVLAELPPQHENITTACMLLALAWFVWTATLAEIFAYYLLGVRRRSATKAIQ